jgi:hypothetical protein
MLVFELLKLSSYLYEFGCEFFILFGFVRNCLLELDDLFLVLSNFENCLVDIFVRGVALAKLLLHFLFFIVLLINLL